MSQTRQQLPPLPLGAWRDTAETVHLWAQIVGKVRLSSTPLRNHWWNAPLYVSTRGLTTRRIAAADTSLEIELDFVGHALRVRTRDAELSFALADGLSVAAFYRQLMDALESVGVAATILAKPFGVPMRTPFAQDEEHASYDADAIERFHQILLWSDSIFEEFAGWFCGKTSPVHFFWHSFDLAVTRFSGRRAAPLPDADPVTQQAYSHEVVSFGFWPGDDTTPEPSFYSYTAPEPDGLREQPLRPVQARWLELPNGSQALLSYEAVRQSPDPRGAVLAFLQSAYEAGASLGGWDLVGLTTDWCPVPVDHLLHLPKSSPSTAAATEERS